MEPTLLSTKTAIHSLTEKEKTILEALSNDQSVKMIAEMLMLSEFTVQDHIKKIKTKLGQHTAVGIVATYIRSGLPPRP